MVRLGVKCAPSVALLTVAIPAAVAAHCAGYEMVARLAAVFGPPVADSHSHHGADGVHAHHIPLIPLTTAATLVGSLVVLAMVVAGRRIGGLPQLRLVPLLAAQIAVVTLIEVASVFGGSPADAMWLLAGLALQAPVAVAAFVLAHHAQRLLARLVTPPRPRLISLAPPTFIVVTAELARRGVWASPATVRGPPAGGANPSRLHPCVAGL